MNGGDLVLGKCARCGAPFEHYGTRRYCSERCRAAAHYARRTESGTPLRQVSIRPEVFDRLAAYCAATGRIKARVASRAINQFLDNIDALKEPT